MSVFFHGELAQATRNFSAEERLGGGGFGGVFRARGLRGFAHASEFAVKRLDADSLQGQAEFLQEVQVLGACRHEHLLPLIGFSADGGEDGRVCLVFPLMQGGSLHDRLAPQQGREPLAWPDRLRASVSVLEALNYLHTPDPTAYKPAILHRDIKPANILLDADGLVRLSDVGLAKMQRDGRTHISLTAVAGTNGFIDPNYMQTGHYDAASDAYSLGVTVLMLLTGWPAFEAGTTVFDRCEGQDAMAVADRQAGWPPEKAGEMLRVGLGLAEPRRRARMQVADALAALTRLVEPADAGGEVADIVERECLLCMAAPKATRLGCGHSTYCRPCLQLAVSRPNPACPYCRRPVVRQAVVEGDDIAQQDTFVMPIAR